MSGGASGHDARPLLVMAPRRPVLLQRGAAPRSLPDELVSELEVLAAGAPPSPALRAWLGAASLVDPDAEARLSEPDAQLAALLPGFAPTRLAAVRLAQARRAVVPWPRRVLGLSPMAVCALAELVRQLSPASIALPEDGSGLSLALAEHAEVICAEPRPVARAWLHAAWAQAGLGGKARLDTPRDCELAVVGVAAPHQVSQALRAGREATRHGRVVVHCRALAEAALREVARVAGLQVRTLSRGLLGDVYPSGQLSDDNGAVVLVEGQGALPEAPADVAAERRAQPYVLLDLDNLTSPPDPSAALNALGDIAAACAPRPEQARRLVRRDEASGLAWYDEGGAGATLELLPGGSKAVLTLMPYDFDVELAFVTAVSLTLGDALLRVRTHSVPPVRDAALAHGY